MNAPNGHAGSMSSLACCHQLKPDQKARYVKAETLPSDAVRDRSVPRRTAVTTGLSDVGDPLSKPTLIGQINCEKEPLHLAVTLPAVLQSECLRPVVFLEPQWQLPCPQLGP